MSSSTEQKNIYTEPVVIQRPMTEKEKESLKLNSSINKAVYNNRTHSVRKLHNRVRNALSAFSIATGLAALWTCYSNENDQNSTTQLYSRLLASSAIMLNLTASRMRRNNIREDGTTIKEVTNAHNQGHKISHISTSSLRSDNNYDGLNLLENISTIAMLGSMFCSLNGVLITGTLAKGFSVLKDRRLNKTMTEMQDNLGIAMPKRITKPLGKSIGNERS